MGLRWQWCRGEQLFPVLAPSPTPKKISQIAPTPALAGLAMGALAILSAPVLTAGLHPKRLESSASHGLWNQFAARVVTARRRPPQAAEANKLVADLGNSQGR